MYITNQNISHTFVNLTTGKRSLLSIVSFSFFFGHLVGRKLCCITNKLKCVSWHFFVSSYYYYYSFFFYLLQYLLSSLKLKPQIFDFHVHINPHYYIDSRVTKVMNTFEICLIVRFSLFLWVYFNDFTPIYRISMMLSKQKKKN